jgi:hypothetical protein
MSGDSGGERLCATCGAIVPPDRATCPECSTLYRTSVAEPPAPDPEPSSEPPPPRSFRPFDPDTLAFGHRTASVPARRAPARRRGRFVAVVAVAVIVVGALAGGGAYLLTRDDGGNTASPPASTGRRASLTDPRTGISWTMSGTPVSGTREVVGPDKGRTTLSSWERDLGDGTIENVRIYDAGGRPPTFEDRLDLLAKQLDGRLTLLEAAELGGTPAVRARIVAREGGERLTFDLVLGNLAGNPVMVDVQRLGSGRADDTDLDRLVRSVRAPATP